MTNREAFLFLKIEKIISIFKKHSRIRRGVVHETVCDTLNVTLNNRNVQLIKMVLKKYNLKEVRIRGFNYYKWSRQTDGK